MLGISYVKAEPTQHVIHYLNGGIRRSGTGLAFFYYNPASSIALVPLGGTDIPFIFNEMAADFQPITVQGQLTYRITNPELVASTLDFTVNRSGLYKSDDHEKLAQRLVNLVQVATRTEAGKQPLRAVIRDAESISSAVRARIERDPLVETLGVELLNLVVLAIKPTPETSRALEAEAREAILQSADLAIYDRRNAAVEQERRIKENELNTEIAVESKQRQIREAKAEADLAIEVKEQQIRETRLAGTIRLETDRKQLVTALTENARKEADNQAYALAASLQPLRDLDDDTRQLLAMQSAEPRLMVTQALREIARNASKIGQLNISPDLMDRLLSKNQG